MASVFALFADVYTKRDGFELGGRIHKVLSDSVYFRVADDRLNVPVSESSGLISVDFVLKENGRVIHASLNNSTRFDLEFPTLEPARVGVQTVKSKLRVPFKLVNTFSTVEEEPPAA